MKKLFLFIIVLICYGSLYPFQVKQPDSGAFETMLMSWNQMTTRGDVLANIVLFVPFGLVGLQAQEKRNSIGMTAVLALSLLVAFGLQFAQLYFSHRDANLADGLWNILGTMIGIALSGLLLKRDIRQFLSIHHEASIVPVLLLVSWLAYRLMPFVPSLDWQLFKNSVKPLLLNPEFTWVNTLHDTLAWSIVYCIITTLIPHRKLFSFVGLGMLLVFSLEIVILDNYLTLNNLLGGALGLFLGVKISRHFPGSFMLLASLLAIMLVMKGLTPFELKETGAFHWIPFYGFLGGSMQNNTAVLFEKMFLYGSYVWLLLQAGVKLSLITLMGVVILTGIEISQLWISNHTPEITDPFLMILIALGFRQHETHLPAAIINQSANTGLKVSVSIMPMNALFSDLLPAEEIKVNKFPFEVGRVQADQNPNGDVHLLLSDTEPFQVSRRHFIIDQENNSVVIRDRASKLGTIVNNVPIGGQLKKKVASLKYGDNSVIAGGRYSKFQFRILVEKAS